MGVSEALGFGWAGGRRVFPEGGLFSGVLTMKGLAFVELALEELL
jgi:hypothetical protein